MDIVVKLTLSRSLYGASRAETGSVTRSFPLELSQAIPALIGLAHDTRVMVEECAIMTDGLAVFGEVHILSERTELRPKPVTEALERGIRELAMDYPDALRLADNELVIIGRTNLVSVISRLA